MNERFSGIDAKLLCAAVALIVAVVVWGLGWPDSLQGAADAALAVTTAGFGWFYLWVVFGVVVFCLVLAFGRHGHLRLGGPDAVPEFSRSAWFAMLFAAGMGIGLVFWGTAEPLMHYREPPPGVVPMSADAANAAMRHAFFHWGLHPWAVYSVVALAIALFLPAKGGLSFSATMRGLTRKPTVRGAWLIDLFAVVTTAFGVATSLGLGALQINSGLNSLYDVPIGIGPQLVIIAAATLLFLASALSGVGRGIKWISSTNLVLAGVLAGTVLLLGPTRAILDTFTTTLGAYISDFVRMSLRLTPFRDSHWTADWTLFYWAWWLSWSPFVGLFIARVSRGRTIREFVTGTLLIPSLACFAWFSVFGGSALNAEIFGTHSLSAEALADPSGAVFRLYETLPLSQVLTILTTLMVMLFFITSADSATVVLSMLSSGGRTDPPGALKCLWGILVALAAGSLLLAGGLRGLQTAAIVAALPFSIVMVLLCASLWRATREHEPGRESRR